MLGREIHDPEGLESGGSQRGLGLLPCKTLFSREKRRRRCSAAVESGPFAGARLEGYEIHMGRTESEAGSGAFCRLDDGATDGTVSGTVFGTYLHGLFDGGDLTEKLVCWLAERKGIQVPKAPDETRRQYRNRQYDLLADTVRKHLNLKAIYAAME